MFFPIFPTMLAAVFLGTKSTLPEISLYFYWKKLGLQPSLEKHLVIRIASEFPMQLQKAISKKP